MTSPLVSVVVISYNDAERLPRAIRSIQRQSLRDIEIIVVDDASTDETAAVVAAMAEADSRIRYECLPQNSGGCSAPRNHGLDVARADWIMFCDSDDEYERHACANLLRAVESHDADLACGTAERIDVRTGRSVRWRPDLHDQTRVINDLSELPELLYDTISVDKIYRRSMLIEQGLRFPEGLLFEDQLFTLQAMTSARRIVVIAETVYRWYVDRLSDEPSITQSRKEVRNVESRIEINRRIDAYLDERGLAEIRRVKDLKFLRHDLSLYLSSMLDVDDVAAAVLVDRLQPYVSELDLSRCWELRPMLRVAIYHLLLGDIAGIRASMRFAKWASVVERPIVVHDGRELWGCSHVESGDDVVGRSASDWLDVTALHLSSIPFTQRRYLHHVERIEVAGGSLAASGTSVDYDGLLVGCDVVELHFQSAGRPVVRIPARWVAGESNVLGWEASGAWDPAFESGTRGTISLAVGRAGLVNVTGVRATEAPTLQVPLARTVDAGAAVLRIGGHDNGAVEWRIPAAENETTSVEEGPGRLPGLAARVGQRLPRKNLVVLHADRSTADGGDVEAIAAALARIRPDMEQVRAVRSTSRTPSDAVVRGSARHAWLLSRAQVVVVDGQVPERTGSSALVVRTGDGAPVHRIGLDDPDVLINRRASAALRREAKRWNMLVAPSSSSGEILSAAYGFRGQVLAAGIPHLDDVAQADREALRARLDLPLDRPVVTYLPVARPDQDLASLLDLEEWSEALGADSYLTVRVPKGMRGSVPTRLRGMVRQLVDADDLPAHLAAADVVISDYSSAIGDAALLDRAVILFQPDRERYVNRTRGLYPGLSEVGPSASDEASLVGVVREWLMDPPAWESRHAPGRRAWAERMCGPADGQAAERVAVAIVEALEAARAAS